MKLIRLLMLGTTLSILSIQVNATGMPVVDIAAILQRAANFITESADLAAQVTALQSELKTYQSGQYKWSDVSGTINQLGSVIEQKNALAYSADNVGTQFQQDFPGYKPSENYTQQYHDNVSTTLSTLSGVLQSLNMSAGDFTNEQTRIQRIQALADNPAGQTQAIQASAVISSETLSQIQMLRQTMMAQTNAQTTYYAQQVQQQATAQEQQHQIIQSGSTNVPAYGTSGHYLSVPNF